MFFIAAIIFIVIYLISLFTLKVITGFLGDKDGYCKSVWVHFLVAFGGGLLLLYLPQNPVHFEPMIAVMAFSVFIAGILSGGIWKPAGQNPWDRVKKWQMTLIPFSFSYSLGWFSAVVATAYLVLEAGQWQGIFPASWDTFAIISDPFVGAMLMIPSAYLGAAQHVYQIPYMKAGDSVSDTVRALNFYSAAANIYDRMPANTTVSRRTIETTMAARVQEESSLDASHRATAVDYLDGSERDQYLSNNGLKQRANTPTAPESAYTEISDSSENGAQRSAMPSQSRFTDFEHDWQYSTARFTDIGGYGHVKHRLFEEVIKPLEAEQAGDDRYERFGVEPARGILFYGPPGTGKTLFARALAGELQAPFVEVSQADLTSKWVNESPQLIRTLFEEAAKLGQCVIFIDEAEHLFGGRNARRNTHAEDQKVTSEFLTNLAREDRDAIVIAATNRQDYLDPAILRPGRLDEHFEIDLPDEDARHLILQTKLEDVPHSVTDEDLATLAAHTRLFTGADLQDLVDDAKRNAASRDADALTIDDFPSVEELDERVAAREAMAEEGTAIGDQSGESGPAPDSAVFDAEHSTQDDDEPPAGYE